MRPPRPVPLICSMLVPDSSTRRRAAGDRGASTRAASRLASVVGDSFGAEVGFSVASGISFFLPPPPPISSSQAPAWERGGGETVEGEEGAAPSSIRPTTAPIVTVLPSGTVVTNLPDAGAATSVVAFSVSNSKTGSSARTFSPFFLSQRDSTPSVIDSPTAGTLISTRITLPLLGGRRSKPTTQKSWTAWHALSPRPACDLCKVCTPFAKPQGVPPNL